MEWQMNGIIEKIHQFFDRFGWEYEFEEETNTWYTAFRAKTSNFPIFVYLTDHFLVFTISPMVNAPEEEACRQNLHTHLLRLNYIVRMAKFSLDEEDNVELSVEVPLDGLEYAAFSDGLNAISHTADMFHLEILNISQDPDYAPKSIEVWVAGAADLGQAN